MKESLNKMWEKLSSWGDNIVLYLPNLIIAIIVFILFLLIGRLMSKYMLKLLKRTTMQDSVKRLIATMTTFVLIVIGLILAMGILNLSTVLKTILTGAGILGLAVGLALQGALANSFAGIFLAVQHYIHIGDFIESNGFKGFVQRINLRNTVILENDNNLVMIPNKEVIDNPVKNYSLNDQTRVILDCGVAYNSPLPRVMEISIAAIVNAFENLPEDKVEFIFTEFGDSSINFRVRFWIHAVDNVAMLKAKSKAIIAIKQAFDKEGIVIPFPMRTLEFNTPLALRQTNIDNKEDSVEEEES